MEHCINEGKIGRMEEAIENLEGWQKTQNGSLQRMETKVEKLLYLIMGVMVTYIFTLITLFLKG